MILFLLIAAIYAGVLLFLKPDPASLKARPLTFSQNFKAIRASLLTGLLLLSIFLFSSNFSFLTIAETSYSYFALKNTPSLSTAWLLQLFSHLFIHIDLLHLITNVSALGLASLYERRVGPGRFLTVLALSSVASIPSLFFYPEGITICGISGGIFGLAAAYFTDHKNLSTREWLSAIAAFIFLVFLFAVEGELKSTPGVQVDHIGHAIGAIAAIVFCRIKPRREK